MLHLALLFFGAAAIFCDDKVKYAVIVHRHGDRTPLTPYPKDPLKEESLWPFKFGELTNTGKLQDYEHGKWIKQRYSAILSEDFDPKELYVRSTDVDRTLMSAQANLAGMYPPTKKYIWKDDLLWQPIPVHTTPEKDDEVLAMKRFCHPYSVELKRAKNTADYKKELSQYQSLMDYLSAYTGMKIKDYDQINDIYNTLYIESLYNFTLPNWTQTVYPDKLKKPGCYSFVTSTMTPLLARLKVGPLLKEIAMKMVAIATNHTQIKLQKLAIYSGHDMTIANLLNALGIFNIHCPDYTASILMELSHDNATNMHYIRILYKNSTEINEPFLLPIPYCGDRCPIERFVKLYENLISVDWSYECGNPYGSFFGLFFCIGLIMILAVYLAHKIQYEELVKHLLREQEERQQEALMCESLNRLLVRN